MKTYLLPISLLLIVATSLYHFSEKSQSAMPEASEGDEQNQLRRKAYFENQHRAAPNVNWRGIEAQNMLNYYENALRSSKKVQNRGVLSTFAGGLLTGTWYERGSSNNAGSMQPVDFDAASEQIYCISAGGSMWRSNLTGTNWTPLNNTLSFASNFIKVIPNGGGRRILASLNQKIYYSNDEAASFSPSGGMVYPVEWGGNYVRDVVVLNDAANTIYALVQAWNVSPWISRFHLYRSIDKGLSFTKFHTFTHGDGHGTSLYVPYNSAVCYILDSNNTDDNGVTSTALYSLNGGTTLTTINAATSMTSANFVQLTGHISDGGATTFYALMEKNKVYRSTDGGATWTLRSNLSTDSWDVGMAVSLSDPNKVHYGEVHCNVSTDGGATWNMLNHWFDYYGDVNTKLHADIMAMRYFRKTDGTEFAINNNHGGVNISYDQMATVQNIGLSNLNISQYYDVRTCPWDVTLSHAGSQDQGEQNTITANLTTPIPLTQLFSGDNGQMVYTKVGAQTYLWSEYPGGAMQVYTTPYGTSYGSGGVAGWSMDGTEKPNTGWMLATSPTANSTTAHEILIGGGNTSGGGGSYLVKLSYNGVFTPFQYPFNFRANSNNISSGISAIATTIADANRYYVATEDGTFFYSTNAGTSWTKSASFSGPGIYYLYGNAIIASKTNANLVYFGGSGYSNPAMYRSTDGGATFTAVSTGLPSTLISDLAFSTDEKFIYAATEAGPYVYSVDNNQWYSLYEVSGTPAYVNYTSVEYIAATNTARFATYGRGIWDLVLSAPLPVELSDFQAKTEKNATILLNWAVLSATNFNKYVVERSADGNTFTTLTEVKSKSQQKAFYEFRDLKPLTGVSYYRLKMVDNDGTFTYSKVESVTINGTSKWKVYPTALPKNDPLSIELPASIERAKLQLFDMSGRLIQEATVSNGSQMTLNNVQSGVYIYQIVAGSERASGKIFVY